jgi:hypothetical protein
MEYQIQVLISKLTISVIKSKDVLEQPIPMGVIEKFNNSNQILAIVGKNVICRVLFQVVDGPSFKQIINDAKKYLQSERLNLIGHIVYMEHNSTGIQTMKMRLPAKKDALIIISPADIDITCKTTKIEKEVDDDAEGKPEKKKALKEHDKIELCKKYLSENGQPPPDNAVIDGFKIGAYYKRLKDFDKTFHEVEAYMRK